VWVAECPFAIPKDCIIPVEYVEPTEHDRKCFVDEQIVLHNIWSFSSSADPMAKIWQWNEVKWLHKLWHGYPLEVYEYDYITRKLRDNSYYKTAIPIMGWAFAFREYLNLYLYKMGEDDTSWQEVWGFSKASIILSLDMEQYGVADILKVPREEEK